MTSVKDLLPLSSYEHTGRLRIIGQMVANGVLFGTSQLFLLMTFSQGFGRAFLSAAISATLFGVCFTLWMDASTKRRIRRLYAGDPDLVAPHPDGRWDFRLQATLMESRRFKPGGIGGHLYVGPDVVHFEPLLDTSKRYRKPITMALNDTRHVDVTDRSEDWLTNMLGSRAPRYLEIWNGERCLLFSVPEPDRVAQSLRTYWQDAAINSR